MKKIWFLVMVLAAVVYGQWTPLSNSNSTVWYYGMQQKGDSVAQMVYLVNDAAIDRWFSYTDTLVVADSQVTVGHGIFKTVLQNTGDSLSIYVSDYFTTASFTFTSTDTISIWFTDFDDSLSNSYSQYLALTLFPNEVYKTPTLWLTNSTEYYYAIPTGQVGSAVVRVVAEGKRR